MNDSVVYPPPTDSAWVTWGQTFLGAVTPDPQAVGLTPEQIEVVRVAFEAYRDAYRVATTPTTRTRPTVAAKDAALDRLRPVAGGVVRVARTFPGITREQLITLGIKPRAARRAIPAPAMAPDIDVLGVSGNVVTIRLHDAQTVGRRRRPKGVAGAAIYTRVGEDSTDAAAFRFRGNVTGGVVEVRFPPEIPPGTTVWITARWYSPRAQMGPGAKPARAVTQWPMQLPPIVQATKRLAA